MKTTVSKRKRGIKRKEREVQRESDKEIGKGRNIRSSKKKWDMDGGKCHW